MLIVIERCQNTKVLTILVAKGGATEYQAGGNNVMAGSVYSMYILM